MRNIADCHLYGILDLGYVDESRLPSVLSEMLEGGVDVVQLRAKNATESKIEALAAELLPLCRRAEVPFIINDFPGIAAKVGVDGVHVGQDDQPISEVREIVGEEMLVGKSTHSLDQARAASRETGVDYIGFGPIFATPTKPDYVPIGKAEIDQVHRDVELPIFCIGGIKRENAPEILQAGAKRLVIVSGILQAANIPEYVRDVQTLLQSNR
tara:strand:- start:6978 stop:7613 length:636 start_codon:yes stop_codon:yes gene_type:complete